MHQRQPVLQTRQHAVPRELRHLRLVKAFGYDAAVVQRNGELCGKRPQLLPPNAVNYTRSRRLLFLFVSLGGDDLLVLSAIVPFLHFMRPGGTQIHGRPEGRLDLGFPAALTLGGHGTISSTGAIPDACGTVGA
jgi:hypothetical protein